MIPCVKFMSSKGKLKITPWNKYITRRKVGITDTDLARKILNHANPQGSEHKNFTKALNITAHFSQEKKKHCYKYESICIKLSVSTVIKYNSTVVKTGVK